MFNDHIKMIKEMKDPEFQKIDAFKALIKCYTANAAYQDMKKVVRKSNYFDLKNYLNLLFSRSQKFGNVL